MTETEAQEPEIIGNKNPTSATDIFNISHRQDGSIMLSMISTLPDNIWIENHRTLVSGDTAKNLVKVLSGLLDYYPEKHDDNNNN